MNYKYPTYEDWQADSEYYKRAKKLADKSLEEATIAADTSYQKALSGYGRNAEKISRMGLSGSGYSAYLDAQAYAAKQGSISSANAQHATQLSDIAYKDYLNYEADKEGYKTDYNTYFNKLKTGNYSEEDARNMMANSGLSQQDIDNLAISEDDETVKFFGDDLYAKVINENLGVESFEKYITMSGYDMIRKDPEMYSKIYTAAVKNDEKKTTDAANDKSIAENWLSGVELDYPNAYSELIKMGLDKETANELAIAEEKTTNDLQQGVKALQQWIEDYIITEDTNIESEFESMLNKYTTVKGTLYEDELRQIIDNKIDAYETLKLNRERAKKILENGEYTYEDTINMLKDFGLSGDEIESMAIAEEKTTNDLHQGVKALQQWIKDYIITEDTNIESEFESMLNKYTTVKGTLYEDELRQIIDNKIDAYKTSKLKRESDELGFESEIISGSYEFDNDGVILLKKDLIDKGYDSNSDTYKNVMSHYAAASFYAVLSNEEVNAWEKIDLFKEVKEHLIEDDFKSVSSAIAESIVSTFDTINAWKKIDLFNKAKNDLDPNDLARFSTAIEKAYKETESYYQTQFDVFLDAGALTEAENYLEENKDYISENAQEEFRTLIREKEEEKEEEKAREDERARIKEEYLDYLRKLNTRQDIILDQTYLFDTYSDEKQLELLNEAKNAWNLRN